jgi:hypothetical protein
MSDRKELSDQKETPKDVAALYSWANVHGAKYIDFSASRQQSREEARLRAEAAIDEKYEPAREDAEAMKAAETQHAAEGLRMAAQAAAQRLEWTTQQTAQEAAQQREWQPPRTSWPGPDSPFGQPPVQPHYAPRREESLLELLNLELSSRHNSGHNSGHNLGRDSESGNSRGTQFDPRETAGRPAWRASEGESAPDHPGPQAPAPQASVPPAPVPRWAILVALVFLTAAMGRRDLREILGRVLS